MQFKLSCTAGTTSKCYVDFTSGGGMGYNIGVKANSAGLKGNPTLNILPVPAGFPDKIQDKDYLINLIDPSTGIFIRATPSLSVGLKASGVPLSGSAYVINNFGTTNSYTMSGSSDSSTITESFGNNIIIDPPIVCTAVTAGKGALKISPSLTATVYWQIGYTLGTASLYVTFSTPIKATYNYYKDYSETCINNATITGSSSIHGITLKNSGNEITIPINIKANPTTFGIQKSGKICVAGEQPALSTGNKIICNLDSIVSTISESGGGTDDSSGLSDGALAAAIVVPILVVFLSIGAYIFFMKSKSKVNDGTVEMRGQARA